MAGAAPGRLQRLWLLAVEREERFLLRDPPRGPRGRAVRAAQVLVLALRACREHHVGDRAASLSFSTLLSLVPMALLGLAGLGASGLEPELRDRARHWLVAWLLPQGPTLGILERSEQALGSLEQSGRALGLIGFVLLVLAGSGLIGTLNRTFRRIWGTRGLVQRLGRWVGFWAAVVAVPVLVAGSLWVSPLLELLPVPGVPVDLLVSLGFGWSALFVAYAFLPGQRASPWVTAAAALVGSLLWELLKLAFGAYLRRALLARAVLPGLGIVPVFLGWVYLSWLVFLLGAEIQFVGCRYGSALSRAGLRQGSRGLIPDPAAADTR